MTPQEFEQSIADLFEINGYEIQLTPKSYDYGVDVIATKGNEKLAIQVKMYDTRLVNYKDVMYLYAGKDIYDCNKGILISLGSFEPLAINVANKLGIEIQDNFGLKDNQLIKGKGSPKIKGTQIANLNDDFELIWQRTIMLLKGQTILTARGMKNRIVDVTSDYILRESSTGKISKIEKQIFKTIYHRLKEKKSISRDEINTEYPSRGSAIITAILAKIPTISLIEKPTIKLIMK